MTPEIKPVKDTKMKDEQPKSEPKEEAKRSSGQQEESKKAEPPRKREEKTVQKEVSKTEKITRNIEISKARSNVAPPTGQGSVRKQSVPEGASTSY